MKKLWRSQRGFTLVELVVVVSILTIVMGTIGAAMFQAMETEKEVVDDGLANSELRKGFS